jgi:hypothetical protein
MSHESMALFHVLYESLPQFPADLVKFIIDCYIVRGEGSYQEKDAFSEWDEHVHYYNPDGLLLASRDAPWNLDGYVIRTDNKPEDTFNQILQDKYFDRPIWTGGYVLQGGNHIFSFRTDDPRPLWNKPVQCEARFDDANKTTYKGWMLNGQWEGEGELREDGQLVEKGRFHLGKLQEGMCHRKDGFQLQSYANGVCVYTIAFHVKNRCFEWSSAEKLIRHRLIDHTWRFVLGPCGGCTDEVAAWNEQMVLFAIEYQDDKKNVWLKSIVRLQPSMGLLWQLQDAEANDRLFDTKAKVLQPITDEKTCEKYVSRWKTCTEDDDRKRLINFEEIWREHFESAGFTVATDIDDQEKLSLEE